MTACSAPAVRRQVEKGPGRSLVHLFRDRIPIRLGSGSPLDTRCRPIVVLAPREYFAIVEKRKDIEFAFLRFGRVLVLIEEAPDAIGSAGAMMRSPSVT